MSGVRTRAKTYFDGYRKERVHVEMWPCVNAFTGKGSTYTYKQ